MHRQLAVDVFPRKPQQWPPNLLSTLVLAAVVHLDALGQGGNCCCCYCILDSLEGSFCARVGLSIGRRYSDSEPTVIVINKLVSV